VAVVRDQPGALQRLLDVQVDVDRIDFYRWHPGLSWTPDPMTLAV
jgi:hypothetical protein